MDYKNLAEQLVKECLSKGANEAEVLIQSRRNLSVEVRNGEIETVEEATSHGVGFRVVVEGKMAFSWIALIVSSILFGLLHSDLIAGIAAGFIFGWVRYRSDSIKDAIVAHASTNLLLSIYVLSTGQWSLW